MSKPVNLYLIYKNVKQRVERSSGVKYEYALQAHACAKVLLDNPTLSQVKKFRVAENKWLKLAGTTSKSIADQFEDAIRSKNYVVQKPILNTIDSGWNPKFGCIYAMTSPDLQGLVKIGATAGEIWELPKRVESYKYRYSLSEVNIALSIYVRYPAEKEREIGRYLDSKRVVGVGKSNEWYKISIYNAKKVINKFCSG